MSICSFLEDLFNRQVALYKHIFKKNTSSYIELIILEFLTFYIIYDSLVGGIQK